MNIKLILSALIVVAFASNSNAQLKVTTATGKVKVGQEPPVGVVTDDPYNVLSVHVYGPYGDYRAGSKLAFGDFGRYDHYGWNVFVGEYGNDWDSDRLWLHGKNGVYMTRGRGDDIIGYYDVATSNNRFIFECDVQAWAYYQPSDSRFKSNIQQLESPLEKLVKLEGVSYTLMPEALTSSAAKPNATNAANKSANTTTTGAATSAKDMQSKADVDGFNKEKQNGINQIGFIAQDLEKVFPDLVKQDKSDYKYINYIGLIPVMVEAIKEQQKIIDAKDAQLRQISDRLAAVEELVNSCCRANNSGNGDGNSDGNINKSSYLYQNVPNPFSATTEIRYFLTENVKTAEIKIYDTQGNILKRFTLEGRGNGSVSVNGSELKAGVYLYALVIDGKEADVKRMSLIN